MRLDDLQLARARRIERRNKQRLEAKKARYHEYASIYGALPPSHTIYYVDGDSSNAERKNMIGLPIYLNEWLKSDNLIGKISREKLKHLASLTKTMAKKELRRMRNRREVEAYKRHLEGVRAAKKRGYRPHVPRGLIEVQSVDDWVKENSEKVKRYSAKGRNIERQKGV